MLDQTVLYEQAVPAAAVAADRAARRAPAAPRYVVRGPRGEWELRDAVTVLGRSRRCDVVLTDPNVSRQHAEIRRQGDGYLIRDLDSTNGVRLNGRGVRQAVLQHGDRIELGTTELLFERVS
jgi:pSer/pThr/pTyr-binding forkhead associated (FHA) protein